MPTGEEKMRLYEEKLSKRHRRATIEGSGVLELPEGDVHISGSGHISEEVIVSGSARLPGGTRAKTVRASGSLRVAGDLSVEEELHCSGSARIQGSVEAGHIHCSGSMRIEGDAKAASIHVSGSFRVAGIIWVTKFLNISGSIRCKEVVSEDLVDIRGSLHTEGRVKSRVFRMNLGHSSSEVPGGIYADEVDVRAEKKEVSGIIIFGFVLFGRRRGLGRLYTRDVVAKGKVHLENTICENVTGDVVEIGPNCEVKNKIKYSSAVNIYESAKVAYPPERVKNLEKM